MSHDICSSSRLRCTFLGSVPHSCPRVRVCKLAHGHFNVISWLIIHLYIRVEFELIILSAGPSSTSSSNHQHMSPGMSRDQGVALRLRSLLFTSTFATLPCSDRLHPGSRCQSRCALCGLSGRSCVRAKDGLHGENMWKHGKKNL